MKLVVIDYESGNLRSVTRALQTHGVAPVVTGDPEELEDADALVLPGVGSGPAAMTALNERGLVGPIKSFAASGKPFLGVCLGLQLLLEHTEEGDSPCLGIVEGRVRKLPEEAKDQRGVDLKVPHMGWNSVNVNFQHPAFAGVPQGSYFYFVHSYYADPTDESGVLGATDYGLTFCSIYARGNLMATQFHPEKSGPTGLRIYCNFVAIAEEAARQHVDAG